MIVKQKIGKKLLKEINGNKENYVLLNIENVPYWKRKEFKLCLPLLGVISQGENVKSTLAQFDPANPIVTDVLFRAMRVIMSDDGGLSHDEIKDYLYTTGQIEDFAGDTETLEIMVPDEAALRILGFSKKNLRDMPDSRKNEVLEEYCRALGAYNVDKTNLDSSTERLWNLVEQYNKTKEELKNERLAEHAAHMDKENDKLKRQGVILKEIKEKTKKGESLSLAERCFLNPDYVNKIKLPEESLKEIASSVIN